MADDKGFTAEELGLPPATEGRQGGFTAEDLGFEKAPISPAHTGFSGQVGGALLGRMLPVNPPSLREVGHQ